ncbi:hypothetical protein EJ574_10470 [Acinetobacter baumannii]|nr:hypothetical protein EJ574_10470 [Acinetobacter baumannii]
MRVCPSFSSHVLIENYSNLSQNAPNIFYSVTTIYYNFSLYTTNFTEPLSYQGSAFLKLPKFP